MNPFVALDAGFAELAAGSRVLVIEDLDLDLRIGVFDSEKGAPQRVRITAEILVVPDHSEHRDDIDRVVSYAPIHDAIVALADRPHIALQETFAEDVARICLEPREAVAARIHVRKLDVYADCASIGIRILRLKPRP